jgi:hypothetical protein
MHVDSPSDNLPSLKIKHEENQTKCPSFLIDTLAPFPYTDHGGWDPETTISEPVGIALRRNYQIQNNVIFHIFKNNS